MPWFMYALPCLFSSATRLRYLLDALLRDVLAPVHDPLWAYDGHPGPSPSLLLTASLGDLLIVASGAVTLALALARHGHIPPTGPADSSGGDSAGAASWMGGPAGAGGAGQALFSVEAFV